MIRVLLGALAGGIITGLARQRRMLSASGQWAGFLLGLLSAAAGWAWAALLVAFFASSTALTQWREEERVRRTERTVPIGSERTAVQVMANGGTFVLLAFLAQPGDDARWATGALGALAAASADSWSTEVGTLLGGTPRSIWTARPVPVGMSGGVTIAGLVAGIAGATFIAGLGAALLPFRPAHVAIASAAAGITGGIADSLVGGALQSKRFCDRCQEWTERRVHTCGFRTKHRAGFYWMTNDLVNLVATGTGAVMAMLIVTWLGR